MKLPSCFTVSTWYAGRQSEVLSSVLAVTSEGTYIPSVLIADDNENIRNALKLFIEAKTNFRVCGLAVDGADAIEKAEEQQPDLIILDFAMPRMNGLEAARILRSRYAQIPIILFTLYAGTVNTLDASEAGVSATFAKTDLPGLLDHVHSIRPAWPPA
jgi:CheY-like chemotaxis protein